MTVTIAKEVQNALPDGYTVEAKVYGLYCCSTTGIDKDAVWEAFLVWIHERFGPNLQEVYHFENTNHLRFNIYLRAGTK